MLNESMKKDALIDVSQPRNSMWVSANAGSGKTKNLITRVARILLQGAPPQKILCLTYTTAAATEMQERLFKELGSWSMKSDKALTNTLLTLDPKFFKKNIETSLSLNKARRLFAKALETPGGLKIQTIHGFCNSVLRKFPLETHISPNFQILDERQKQEFVNRTMIEMLEKNSEAFENVIKIIGISDLKHFIDQVLLHKLLLIKPFNLKSFCECFKLSIQGYQVDQELGFIFAGLPNNFIQILSEAFANGSNTDVRQAEYLKNMVALDDLGKLDMLEKFACTKDGKLRASRSFPGKQTKLLNPEIEGLFVKFKENFLNYLIRRTEFTTVKKAEVLYGFSEVFFTIFEHIKSSEGYLDYDDLIIKTRDLLNDYQSKWVLYKLDGGIDHILLDEAQDTSIHQWEMLTSLMDDFFSDERSLSGKRTFYAVGDEKQSIYSFQGADIKSFSYMKNFFSNRLSSQGNKLANVELTNSFRSSKAILDFVNKILNEGGGGTGVSDIGEHIAFHEDLPGRVELWPFFLETNREGSKAWWSSEREFIQISEVERLAENIAGEIYNILASDHKIFDPNSGTGGSIRKVLASDFLILVRNRGDLFNSILNKLMEYNLPVAGSDRLILLDELAVKDIISLLRFLTNDSDDLSLAEALRSPLLGFSEEDLFKIAYAREGSLYDSLQLNAPEHDACRILKVLLDDVKRLTPYELIEKVLIKHNGRLNMSARLGVGVNDVLDEFLDQALSYEDSEPPSTFGFLTWLDTIQIAVKRQLQNNSPNIRVMTIHGSKGLESPIVIIPDTFNSSKNTQKSLFLEKDGLLCFWDSGPYVPKEVHSLKEQKLLNELEEENRLFYVAITRARNWLIICGVTKKKESEDSFKSSWYFKSQKALEELTNKKLVSSHIKDKLIYEYNWISNNLEQPSHNIKDETKDVNGEGFTKRIKSLLIDDITLKNDLGLSLSVSELLKKLTRHKSFKSVKADHPRLFVEDTTIYGSIVHLFLQLLPTHFDKNMSYIKDLVHKRFKEELKDFNIIEMALFEAKTILEKPDLRSLITDPNSFRELSVSSLLTLPKMSKDFEKKQFRIRGRLDLLRVTKSKVLVVDFKTNAKVPSCIEDVDNIILSQMELYSRIVSQAYPSQEIFSSILWTKTAHLMDVPRVNSNKAFNTLFANQVLDDV